MKNSADNHEVKDEHSEINIESMEDGVNHEELVKPSEFPDISSEKKVIVENTILTNLKHSRSFETNNS